MIWEVFRQTDSGSDVVHCGNVHAPDAELAKQFASIQHARRKPARRLWVVPAETIHVVEPAEGNFGGSTDKSYRWATTYNVDASFAEEIAASEREQEDAERQREEAANQGGGGE